MTNKESMRRGFVDLDIEPHKGTIDETWLQERPLGVHSEFEEIDLASSDRAIPTGKPVMQRNFTVSPTVSTFQTVRLVDTGVSPTSGSKTNSLFFSTTTSPVLLPPPTPPLMNSSSPSISPRQSLSTPVPPPALKPMQSASPRSDWEAPQPSDTRPSLAKRASLNMADRIRDIAANRREKMKELSPIDTRVQSLTTHAEAPTTSPSTTSTSPDSLSSTSPLSQRLKAQKPVHHSLAIQSSTSSPYSPILDDFNPLPSPASSIASRGGTAPSSPVSDVSNTNELKTTADADHTVTQKGAIPPSKPPPTKPKTLDLHHELFRSKSVDSSSLVDKTLFERYHIIRYLASGAFSRVYLARDTANNNVQLVACKIVPRERLRTDARVRNSLEREGLLLHSISHPHIVRLHETIQSDTYLCLVLDYIEGGDLFDLVQRSEYVHHDNVDEAIVRQLFLQLVDAVDYLHKHDIVHRDIKLENVLITDKNPATTQLKLTDFGLAKTIDPNNYIQTTRCGSEEYAAPEILTNKGYDGRKTDVWALGVILYALLVGYLPFTYLPEKGERVTVLFYRIAQADVRFEGQRATLLSPQAQDVVRRILARHPDRRATLSEVKAMPWF